MKNRPENGKSIDTIHDQFPFKKERPYQTKALDRIADFLNGPKKYCLLEGPTGFGKSAVGIAAARFAGSAYIMSPQITLAAQYMRDFSALGLRELKGAANYNCDLGMDCETAAIILGRNVHRTRCTGYFPARQEFMAAPMGVTNFAYLLKCQDLPMRELLIVDECHGAENAILSQVDLGATRQQIEKNGFHFPAAGGAFVSRAWAREYKDHLSGLVSKLNDRLMAQGQDTKVARKLATLRGQLERVRLFLTDSEQTEWFIDRAKDKLTLRPFSAAHFAQSMLFAKCQKVLLMSATILKFSALQKVLGIDPEDAETFAAPCDFPRKNRRIIFLPVDSMSYRNRNQTMPRMVGATNRVVARYPDQKGIIHTHSFALNEKLAAGIEGRTVLTHKAGEPSARREEIIKRHKEAKEPTVLMSPSMVEGLDLRDDESRFQILVKVPYPNLGDPYTAARMQRDSKWYAYQTALAIIQACGRSVRHANDWAETWILDADFEGFLERNRRLFPRWWLDAFEVYDLRNPPVRVRAG
jgi:Rad3-related DNA helicase